MNYMESMKFISRKAISAPAMRYTARKPRGPVLENTTPTEVATPTCKRGFVTSKFLARVRLHLVLMVSGGMGRTATSPARLLACFQHPAHPLRLKTQTVVFLGSPTGIQTMTATATQAIRATSPTLGNPDLIQLHAQAHNALAMAVYYLNQPQANLPGARRKAVQALAALRGLTSSLEG